MSFENFESFSWGGQIIQKEIEQITLKNLLSDSIERQTESYRGALFLITNM